MPWITPWRLMSTIRTAVASSSSMKRPSGMMPALLTSTSSGPKRSSAASTKASKESRLVTSSSKPAALGPISAAACSASSASRSPIGDLHPLAREGLRRRLADAACGAGDRGDLADEDAGLLCHVETCLLPKVNDASLNASASAPGRAGCNRPRAYGMSSGPLSVYAARNSRMAADRLRAQRRAGDRLRPGRRGELGRHVRVVLEHQDVVAGVAVEAAPRPACAAWPRRPPECRACTGTRCARARASGRSSPWAARCRRGRCRPRAGVGLWLPEVGGLVL